jgi:ribonucleoside-diphosphate reductase beta chain
MPVSAVSRPQRLLDPGLCLTLRPMVYPRFYEMYRDAIKNTWTVEEIDFAADVGDLQKKMTDAERHLVHRLVMRPGDRRRGLRREPSDARA